MGLPDKMMHKDTGKTVLVKAAFAGNTSWCQHRILAIEGSVKVFSEEKHVCVGEVSSLFAGASGCLVFFPFFLVLRSSEKREICALYYVSAGHDSGDECGKAQFMHII